MSTVPAEKTALSKKKMALHFVLSFIMPLYGFIIGGIAFFKAPARKKQAITILILSLVVTGLHTARIIVDSLPNEEKTIAIVRNGHLNGHPKVTVGKAFSSLMKANSEKWSAFKANDGYWYVDGEGQFLFLGESIDAVIRFQVETNDRTFGITDLTLNGEHSNDKGLENVLTVMYQN